MWKLQGLIDWAKRKWSDSSLTRGAEPIPTTFEGAIQAVREFLEAQSLGDREDGYYLHHGYGMHIRNAWGLWGAQGSTPLISELNTMGLFHADDMSGLIIHCALRDLARADRGIESEVKKYQDHWAKYSG
jgi:hypothetical protein